MKDESGVVIKRIKFLRKDHLFVKTRLNGVETG